MNKQKTITINGVHYDAHTGMRVSDADTTTEISHNSHHKIMAHTLHAKTQRTQTLKRSHVKAPTRKTPQSIPHQAVAKSPMISKFAPRSMDMVSVPKKAHVDIQPVMHPHQRSAQLKQAPARVVPKHTPAVVIKEREITKALERSAPVATKKRSFLARHPRVFSITTASLVVVFLAGFLTYSNLPGLSVRVAAAQAGINATFPNYQPSGYRQNGPVAFKAGQVTIEFTSNASSEKFTITQEKSSWDSSALLENMVEKDSKGNFTTYSDDGLKIYVYSTNAAWVNGGILHTIKGNAPLTNQQIRKIATSM